MRSRIGALLVVGLAGTLAACETEGDGKCGTYTDTAGTARITAVAPAPAGESNCTNAPVKVTFDFVPTDPADAALAATGVQLTIGEGNNPPQAWVEAEGLQVGSEHPAIRSDEHGGACPPLIFRLTDVDEAAARAACF